VHAVAADSRDLHYRGKSPQRGSMVSAPLISKRQLLGVLNLHKYEFAAFSDSEIKLIQTVVSQAAIAIENAQLYEKTKNLSNTDELTGLANRRYFQEILAREVAQARRYGTGFSVVLADIDHFKAYNDTHGHLRGDAVLRKVAAILLQNTRGIDLVARFGGEEFIVLLPKTTTEGGRAAADKLRQCVAAEVFSGAERSQPGGRLTLSLGVAEYPRDSKDIYELLDLADQALYRAKQSGRNATIAWNGGEPPQPGLFSSPAP
jgi:diguanylate cyclase (GGDEF)-like protein